jgi:prophage maintenance system killer protein
MIISVGYRVNSKKGTQFRIWANNILKQYLIEGYALNEEKLKAQQEKLNDLKLTIALSSRLFQTEKLSASQSQGILAILEKYSHALTVLDDYDHQRLQIEGTQVLEHIKITYDEAIEQIRLWRHQENLSTLFGNEKDDSFKSSLETIYQTFGGIELYPSIEEKAANLLYFIVKNHSFTDGNKRIAAAIFVWFLERHDYLYNIDGEKRVADNALVAFTLLIAESKPDEKETIVKVIINLINGKN